MNRAAGADSSAAITASTPGMLRSDLLQFPGVAYQLCIVSAASTTPPDRARSPSVAIMKAPATTAQPPLVGTEASDHPRNPAQRGRLGGSLEVSSPSLLMTAWTLPARGSGFTPPSFLPAAEGNVQRRERGIPLHAVPLAAVDLEEVAALMEL